MWIKFKRKLPCLNTRKKKKMKATTHWICFWIPMVPLTQSAMNVPVCILFLYRVENGRNFFSPLNHCGCFHGLRLTKSTRMTHSITMVRCAWTANLDGVGIYHVQERLEIYKDQMIFKKEEWDAASAKTIGKTSGCQHELWLLVDLQE